jgi:hypothetical protein
MRWPSPRSLSLAVTLLPILIATLWPLPGHKVDLGPSCILCGDHATADVLLNVTLFLPLGAALALSGRSLGRCALLGALLSACIEFAQLSIPGRDSSLGDVIANTLGTTLGAIVLRTAPVWLLPPAARAAWLSRAAVLFAVALAGLTGLLLSPALPDSRYYGRWTPHLGHLESYGGQVQEASIAVLPIRPGLIPHPLAVRNLLLSSSGFTVHVRAIAGAPTPALGALVAIFDDKQREILLLGPDREDLVFRMRTRATELGLDQPDIRLRNGMRRIAVGDTLDVTVHGGRGPYRMRVNDRSASGLGFSVGDGWALLLYPEMLPAWLSAVLSVTWIWGLFVPAGFWIRGLGNALLAGVVLAAGLASAPPLTSLIPTPLSQWVAAAAGLLAGAALQRLISRRPSGARPA